MIWQLKEHTKDCHDITMDLKKLFFHTHLTIKEGLGYLIRFVKQGLVLKKVWL